MRLMHKREAFPSHKTGLDACKAKDGWDVIENIIVLLSLEEGFMGHEILHLDKIWTSSMVPVPREA